MPLSGGRVPRERLFTPQDILERYQCRAWFDAADLNTIILNGATVSQWRDKSGYMNHVSQSTSASQPGYHYRTSTTPAYVDFTVNVPSNLLTGSSPTVPTGNNPRTIVACYTPQSTASGNAYVSWGFSATGQLCQIQNFSSHDPYFGGDAADTDSGIAFASGVRMLMDWAHTNNPSNAQRISKNGGTPVTSSNALNTTTTQALEICAGNQGNGQQCYMHEVLIFASRVPDAILTKIQGYLAWKWGLQGSLPSTHPHAQQAPLAVF